MNEYDSDQVSLMLEEAGYVLCDTEDEADIILFNTCSVRKHAEDRVVGRVMQLKGLKEKRPGLIIGIMGCMANAYKDELLKEYPQLDFVSGTRDFTEIPKILEEVIADKSQRAFVNEETRGFTYPELYKDTTKLRSYVPIMRGCDNYCSYCIVPFVRGHEISRPSAEIIREVTFLASHGVQEIVLLGQNVNSYGKGLASELTFPDLLNQVSNVPGISIVRFLTSHPKDVSPELFDAMRDNPKIEKHLHLPLQSGSNDMLKAMNRQYTIESYIDHVHALKMRIPHVSITTDIIVGFCGETERDYELTKDAFRKVAFDNAFIFKYSPREGTKAYTLQNSVAQKEKELRNNDLLALQRAIAHEKNKNLIGLTEKAIVYAVSKKNPNEFKARTVSDREVVFPGTHAMIGKMVSLRFTDISNQTFIGVLNA
jgi:tRNA-2-methylthio-N6-dimethylallyladenosine synthase